MGFCGHCGFLLPPESSTCPRCGKPVEPELRRSRVRDDDSRADDATIAASRSSYPLDPPARQPISQPQAPGAEQQPLILSGEPGGYSGPAFPGARWRAANASTHQPAQPFHTTPGGPNTSYPVSPWPAGLDPRTEAPPARRRGRSTALLLILLGLLLLLGAVALFTLQYTGVIGGRQANATPTLTPAQQVQGQVLRYYADVNRHDYAAAYNLWWQPSMSYNEFAAGYAKTLRDDVTITTTSALPDSTYKVDITIQAQEQGATGTITSTYLGSYIVGLREGEWKFLSGSFQKAP